jgi:hypothetical protein
LHIIKHLKKKDMKTFTTLYKGQIQSVVAFSKQDAEHKFREILGQTMRGQFYPLHWSEIGAISQVK